MANPFGMAYGIGAGLAGVPQAYQQAQDLAAARALRGMQMAEAQRQLEEDEATRQIMSQPVAQPAPTDIQQSVPSQAEMDYQAMAEHNVAPGEFGPNPTEGVEPPAPSGETRTRQIQPFSTPQQKQAYEARSRAERLRQIGAWKTASALEDHANLLEQQHSKVAREGLARAVAMGSDNAIDYLHGLGAVNAVDVRPNEDGGITIFSRDPNGKVHPISLDKEEYTGIISGHDPAQIFQGAASREMRMRQLEAQMQRFQQGEEGKTQRAQMGIESRERIADMRLRAQRAGLGSNRTPAKIATWNFAEAQVRRLNPGASEEEILEKTQHHPLVTTAAASTEKTDRNIASKMLADIRKGLGGQEPGPNDPEFKEYQRLKRMALPALYEQTVPAHKPIQQAPTPSNIPEGTRGTAKDGTPVIRRNGKWVAA